MKKRQLETSSLPPTPKVCFKVTNSCTVQIKVMLLKTFMVLLKIPSTNSLTGLILRRKNQMKSGMMPLKLSLGSPKRLNHQELVTLNQKKETSLSMVMNQRTHM